MIFIKKLLKINSEDRFIYRVVSKQNCVCNSGTPLNTIYFDPWILLSKTINKNTLNEINLQSTIRMYTYIFHFYYM